MTKLQVGITSALAVAGTAGFVLQAQSNATLREEVAALRQEAAGLATLRAENTQLARAAAEVADLRRDDAELKRLSDEATAVQVRLQQVVRAEQARAAAAAATETFHISRLDRTPTPRFQARPQYPAALKAVGVEGEVVVDFIVDANGEVRNARAIRSSLKGQGLSNNEGTVNAQAANLVVKMSGFTVAGESGGGSANLNGVDVAQSARLLEAAAVDAVGQWKFKAGQKGGRDVNTHMQIPIVFSLSDGKVLPNGPKVIAPNGAAVFTPEGAAVIAPKP